MIKIFILQVIFIITQTKQLVLIQQTFRHGARYPLFYTKADYSKVAQEIFSGGQLTSQGKHMHYALGKILYKKYWELLFHDTPYINKYNQSQFYVKSTDVNRTIQSAESQIFGLLEQLPPLQLNKDNQKYSLPAWKGYQQTNLTSPWNIYHAGPAFHPIPIHVQKRGANPYDQGDFLRQFDPKNCPNIQMWIKENKQNQVSKEVQKNQKVMEAKKALQQAINQTVEFYNIAHYIDSYQSLKYLNFKYLSVFEDKKYADTFDFIMSFSLYNKLYYQENEIKAIATNYIKKTLQNFEQKKNNTFTPRMVLYSAHDTTVAMVLSALNMTNVDCIVDHYLNGVQNDDSCVWQFPPFSANIIFELWNDSGNYTIQVLYNGEKRKIPICNYSYECTLEQFKQWHDIFVIKDSFIACGLGKPQNSYIGVVIFLIIVVLILVGYLVFIKLKKQKRISKSEEGQGYEENFEEKEQQMGTKQ